MKQPSLLDDLHYIVESIDVSAEGQLSFQGQPYEGYDYPEASMDIKLFHNLTNLPYSACYTRSRETRHHDFDNHQSQTDSFLAELRKANASVERYDCGWIVDQIEHGGNIIVRKGGYKRYTYAGNFIREHFRQGPLQRGELVNIRVVPDQGLQPEAADIFYYVFGQTLLEDNHSSIVRLYFSLMQEGAVPLVALISNNLNFYNIPFQFKCINRPSLYKRCDAAVLYIDKRYFNIVSDLLSELYPKLKNKLNPHVPMFTRPIALGISFAETPFSSSESFGTNRCKIISQGIVNAWKENQAKKFWMDFIIASIQENYLHLETLHLNPNSKYPYHFPTFE